jgi:hypothetical protein
MQLTWTEMKTDEGENTWHRSESAVHDDGTPFIYRIRPGVWRNQLAWSIDGSSRELVSSAKRLNFPTVEAAKRECQRLENLATGHVVTPEEAIREWAVKNPRLTHIEPERLFRACSDVPKEALISQLTAWVDAGKLKKSIGVLAPSGSHAAEGYWDSSEDIPGRLHDTADDRFKKDDGKIIHVLRKPDESPISTGI